MTDIEKAIGEVSSQVLASNSFSDLQECMPRMRDVFSLKQVIYQGLIINGQTGTEQLILSTCPNHWTKEYETRRAIEWDPIAKAARQSVMPVDWATVDWSSAGARRYRLMLERHNIGLQGTTIPLYSPFGDMALFSFSGSLRLETFGAFRRRYEGEIAVLALKFHDRVLSLAKGGNSLHQIRLTPKVTTCLELLAQGRKPAEIGAQLGLSIHTVRKHLNRAVDELSCQTKAEAITRALALGLIRARTSHVANLLMFIVIASSFDLPA